jgi:hypothetical protein
MAMKPFYYIVCFETGEQPNPWAWELKRRGEPMGVKVIGRGYQSKTAAEYAGRIALQSFIEALAKETRLRG